MKLETTEDRMTIYIKEHGKYNKHYLVIRNRTHLEDNFKWKNVNKT